MDGMVFLIPILLLFSSSIFARCETYSRAGSPVKICWSKELKGFVSERCQKSCLGKRFIQKHHGKARKLKTFGGANPASAQCKFHGLAVHVLKDPRGAEQSFCVFADGSLVDSNAVARGLR